MRGIHAPGVRSLARGVCAALLAISGGAALAIPACAPGDPLGAPRGARSSGAGGELDVGDTSAPPSPDAGGLCGNQIHQAITDAPNLYFVLDASGSMAAPERVGNRFDAVRTAAVDLLRGLGALVQVGAAVFPFGASDGDSCRSGEQVMAVAPGDAITGKDGPTIRTFMAKTQVTPFGGTPVAATLEALAPTLRALPGRTVVLLATDGGPNCNEGARCTKESCMPNIDGQCTPSVNCCEPPYGGPANCVDEAATVEAIEALSSAGVQVYVLGIPGSEAYGDVLDAMALAGGTAQPFPPFYYKVSDVGDLRSALGSIASVVISCAFELVDAPPDRALTNVYLDQELLLYSEQDGWSWASETAVELRGVACQRLKEGQIQQVQIVSGCPTEVAQ